MKKGKLTIVLVLVGLIVLGICVGIFIIKKDKVDTQLANKQTIYVEAYDAETDEKLKANFVIVINKTVVAEGTTNLKGVEEVVVSTIEGINTYILCFNNDYYVQQGLYLNNPFSLDLYRKGKAELIDVNTFDNGVNLTIKATDGQYRQLGFVVGWSYSFLEVWNDYYLQGEYMDSKEKCENYGLTWSEINETYGECELEYINVFPSRLKHSADRAYYVLHTLAEDENMTITLNYDMIQDLDEDDNLEIIFFDSDRNSQNKYGIEDMEGNNIGSRDYKYVLSSDCLKGGVCELQEYEEDY